MTSTNRIYLDNAATSFPKPEVVYDAIDAYNRNVGVPLGRGAYREAMQVKGVVAGCRKQAADLLGAENLDRVIFTFNGTDSLNLALQGLLSTGDHVVTSTIEHNSVLRPLRELQTRAGIQVSYVEADQQGRIEPADVRAAIRPETRLVAIIHVSNVTGTIQPIADFAEIAKQSGALFLVDAAQTAGHLPIDVSSLPIDLLACPGHKGLLGPLGTGLLYVRPGVEEELRSVRQGGTGSNSENDHQPLALPDKYEAGNHNIPGLFGLEAALTYLHERSVESIRGHEQELTGRLLDGLRSVERVELYGSIDPDRCLGVVSLNIAGFDPQVLAGILDESFSIQTRAGLHCAPGAHRAIGTFGTGGTVRFSTGPFTSSGDIDAAVDAVRNIARSG